MEGLSMFQMLISLFGIAIVSRNLSLLGKFEVLSKRKIFLLSIILQLPLFLFVFFKEQITLTLLFIGIFSLTLIFYRRILMKWARFTYEKRHLRVLDHLILLLKSGKSAQSSLKIVLDTFSNWERLIFQPLETIFEMKERENNPEFEYEIACDQMCGNGHYSMKGIVKVVTQQEFDLWLAAQKPKYYESFPEKDPNFRPNAAATDTTKATAALKSSGGAASTSKLK